MLNKRSRIVSIRLSEDEYRKLSDICVQTGARSVSDLARQRLVYASTNGKQLSPDLQWRLSQIDGNLNSLRDEVARLATIVGVHEPGAPPDHASQPRPIEGEC